MQNKVGRPSLRPVPGTAVKRLREQIARLDWVCPGTLLKRWKLCGKPNCRCAKDPAARHGPYYEWSRWKDGHLRHSVISSEQARFMEKALAQHDRVLRLLRRWSEETVRAMKTKISG